MIIYIKDKDREELYNLYFELMSSKGLKFICSKEEFYKIFEPFEIALKENISFYREKDEKKEIYDFTSCEDCIIKKIDFHSERILCIFLHTMFRRTLSCSLSKIMIVKIVLKFYKSAMEIE